MSKKKIKLAENQHSKRLRKHKKTIERLPKLKRKIAEFLVKLELAQMSNEKMKEILLIGYTGKLARSTNNLTKEFDQLYDVMQNDMKQLCKEEMNIENVDLSYLTGQQHLGQRYKKRESSWRDDRYYKAEALRHKTPLKVLIENAEAVYSEIFEEIFL